MVHLLYALSGRDLAGPPRSAPELSDDDHLPHRYGDRQLLAAGRCERRCRGDADDVRPAFARAGEERLQPAVRGRRHLPAGIRRARDAQRTLRYRNHPRQLRHLQVHRPGVRCHRAVSFRVGPRPRLCGIRRRCSRGGCEGGCRVRSDEPRAAHLAGPVGRRHRGGFRTAVRSADGLRWPDGRLHDHQGGLQTQHARSYHRRIGGQARQQGAAHGAPDA